MSVGGTRAVGLVPASAGRGPGRRPGRLRRPRRGGAGVGGVPARGRLGPGGHGGQARAGPFGLAVGAAVGSGRGGGGGGGVRLGLPARAGAPGLPRPRAASGGRRCGRSWWRSRWGPSWRSWAFRGLLLALLRRRYGGRRDPDLLGPVRPVARRGVTGRRRGQRRDGRRGGRRPHRDGDPGRRHRMLHVAGRGRAVLAAPAQRQPARPHAGPLDGQRPGCQQCCLPRWPHGAR